MEKYQIFNYLRCGCNSLQKKTIKISREDIEKKTRIAANGSFFDVLKQALCIQFIKGTSLKEEAKHVLITENLRKSKNGKNEKTVRCSIEITADTFF